ncbi:MAG TPA: metallophosphoesterase [Chloroflexota bacterium]|nr:metallophosphoesterase [Chloroflexota bacterium]
MTKTRIFFASDVHGSERCWRKFLNAGKFYGVDVLIMGGDIAGKLIIPLLDEGNGHYSCHFHGDQRTSTEAEVEALEKRIRDGGYYPVRMTPEEVEANDRKEAQDALFERVMVQEFERWLQIAEEKLTGTGIRCFVSPGNDDIFALDTLLRNQTVVEAPDGQRLKIDDEHEIIGVGYSTPTPWHTERECSEEEYASKLDRLAEQIEDTSKAIFDIHCPPYDSGLDHAPKLTDDLRPVTIMGQPQLAPVGSTAVRDAILRYQPLLGLHGHVHESKGIVKLGRTVCINPGSEYTEGELAGALVRVNGGKVDQYQLVTG